MVVPLTPALYTPHGGTMTDQYYGANWPDVRAEVIESHGSECLLCGESGDGIHVHHIQPIKDFENPEDANDTENLAPLCERCHHRVERIQESHTRRTIEHFVEELRDEGLPDLSGVIEHLCYQPLKTNDLDACPNDGCYYPVKETDFTCPSCGGEVGGGLEPPGMDVDVGYWVCRDCGYHTVGERPEPPMQHLHSSGCSSQSLEFVEGPDVGFDVDDPMEYECSRCSETRMMLELETVNSHGCTKAGGHHNWVLVEGEMQYGA